jgi:hypothetical protein
LAERVGPILAATVTVPDLELAVKAYRSLLGYAELASGTAAGERWQVLGPAGADWGLVRLVEVPGCGLPPTFRTLGWSALEILVKDADATYARCLEVEGFEVLQPPVMVGAGGSLRALQARGPGGEGVYLTQVLAPSEKFQLPSLQEGEHRVYVVVVGTQDVDVTRGFFEQAFGVSHVTDHALPVKVLNQAYGLPPGTLHRLSTLQLAGNTVVEIDEYPAEASDRADGWGGLRSVTFVGPKPALGSPQALGASSEPPYGGLPAWGILGPFGLRLEVVERRQKAHT